MIKGKIRGLKKEVLSDNWYVLNKLTYEYQQENGQWQTQIREAYDRGNGATILLYNKQYKTVILTRQFRAPTYINNNPDGMMIETCAGLLDMDQPTDCIIKETQEETGYKISKAKKVFQCYMSPGSVTEIVHFFVGEYNNKMKMSDGGGLDHEQENIEVLEYTFKEAYKMIASGEIKDAKTILLLQYAKIMNLV